MIAIFPEIVSCAAAGDIDRLGILVRNYFGGKEKYSAKINAELILETFGIPVHHMPLDCQGAIMAKDEKGTFTTAVAIREGLDTETERFLLAHLLGHFLLHIQPLIAQGDFSASGYRENICPMKRFGNDQRNIAHTEDQERKEIEADLFAAALLMPAPMLARAREKLSDLEKTAEFFGVSAACMERRLELIGMEHRAPENFFEAEKKVRDGQPEKRAAATTSKPIDEAFEKKLKPITKLPHTFEQSNYKAPLKRQEQNESAGVKSTMSRGMDRIRQIAKMLDKNI